MCPSKNIFGRLAIIHHCKPASCWPLIKRAHARASCIPRRRVARNRSRTCHDAATTIARAFACESHSWDPASFVDDCDDVVGLGIRSEYYERVRQIPSTSDCVCGESSLFLLAIDDDDACSHFDCFGDHGIQRLTSTIGHRQEDSSRVDLSRRHQSDGPARRASAPTSLLAG